MENTKYPTKENIKNRLLVAGKNRSNGINFATVEKINERMRGLEYESKNMKLALDFLNEVKHIFALALSSDKNSDIYKRSEKEFGTLSNNTIFKTLRDNGYLPKKNIVNHAGEEVACSRKYEKMNMNERIDYLSNKLTENHQKINALNEQINNVNKTLESNIITVATENKENISNNNVVTILKDLDAGKNEARGAPLNIKNANRAIDILSVNRETAVESFDNAIHLESLNDTLTAMTIGNKVLKDVADIKQESSGKVNKIMEQEMPFANEIGRVISGYDEKRHDKKMDDVSNLLPDVPNHVPEIKPPVSSKLKTMLKG